MRAAIPHAGNLLHIRRAIDETIFAKTLIPKAMLIYEKHDVDAKSRRFRQEGTLVDPRKTALILVLDSCLP